VLIEKEGKFGDVISDKDSDFNILIEGDNYHSLSVLKYTHRNRIDVIYIDPPYNTGNEDFIYNDNFVDRDDTFRHSRWLSFMNKRLVLAKDLLKDDGVIFISIDSNEQAQLKLLCDEIFKQENYINTFTWVNNLKGRQISNIGASQTYEYILCYSKNFSSVPVFTGKSSLLKQAMPEVYKIKDYEVQEDEHGEYVVKNELYNTNSFFNEETRPNLVYNIYYNSSDNSVLFSEADKNIKKKGYIKIEPKINNNGTHKYHAWRWGREKVERETYNLVFTKYKNTYKIYSKVREVDQTTLKDIIVWYPTSSGGSLLKNILGKKDNGEDWKIIFRSPTGSGKTLMASQIIERISFEYHKSTSFIWLSKGQLADQSKQSFQKYLGGGGMRFSSIDEVSDNEIKDNEILFMNWEKLFTKANRDNPAKDIKSGDYTNVFMRENEQDRNLRVFCENTRRAGRKIVLIIDESHLNITAGALEIIEGIIQPDLRIDITATPKDLNYDYGDRDGEFVTLKEVREQKMIKQEVVINPDLDEDDILKSELDGDTLVLHKAIAKRKELESLYQQEKSEVRPLVLIQLPNNKATLSSTDKQKIDFVEQILMTEFDVSYENGRLAKWLSDKSDKVNLEDITKPDSAVDFLIFKQAIATGWDCPRAHILVKFRETGTATFEIQTVGRIMRMPEFKHYENEELNRAYVYANLSEIDIHQDAFEYIKDQQSRRKTEYKDINLKSTYLQRSEYNDILHDYQNFLFDELIERIDGNKDIKKSSKNSEKFLKLSSKSGEKISLDTKLKESIILNATVLDIDHTQDIDNSNLGEVTKSEFDVSNQFMNFLASHTGEFQQARSKGKIKIALYQALEKYLGMTSSKEDLQRIILNNTWFFIDLIDASVEKYAKIRIKKDRIEKINENWNVPLQEFLPKNYTEKEVSRCIINPFYTGIFQTENGFIDHYLETHSKIKWWYQNGEKNEVYFAIPYTENSGKKSSFYPDFIVQYKDGRIGIFDTKKGDTATKEDTVLKANALSKYIESEKKNGKNLFGGIVVPDQNNKNFKLNENMKHNYSYPEGNWVSL